jgi:hypothetical protein
LKAALLFTGCASSSTEHFQNASSVKRLDGSAISANAIDSTVERLKHAARVPGLGLAIFDDRKIVYLKTYGERDRTLRLPLQTDTIMSAASLSKVAFAYMVMQLVQEGWRNYAVYFQDAGAGMLMMTNRSNGEGIYKELLETLQGNTFTPIEWEGFTPYNQLPVQRLPLRWKSGFLSRHDAWGEKKSESSCL